MPNICPDPVLASGELGGEPDKTSGSPPVFGLVITVLHPAPSPLISFYETFCCHLKELLEDAGVLDTHYLLYPPHTLHCTVATVRPFKKVAPQHPERTISFWRSALERIEQMPNWPESVENSTFDLCGPQVFDNGVGVFLFDDKSGAMNSLRRCLEEEMACFQATLPEISDVNMEDVRIPNIIHSTVLRWRSWPAISNEQLQRLFNMAYEGATVTHTTNELRIGSICLLRESLPFMQKLTCCHEAPVRIGNKVQSQGGPAD